MAHRCHSNVPYDLYGEVLAAVHNCHGIGVAHPPARSSIDAGQLVTLLQAGVMGLTPLAKLKTKKILIQVYCVHA